MPVDVFADFVVPISRYGPRQQRSSPPSASVAGVHGFHIWITVLSSAFV